LGDIGHAPEGGAARRGAVRGIGGAGGVGVAKGGHRDQGGPGQGEEGCARGEGDRAASRGSRGGARGWREGHRNPRIKLIPCRILGKHHTPRMGGG
jgi:hypothetical protein